MGNSPTAGKLQESLEISPQNSVLGKLKWIRAHFKGCFDDVPGCSAEVLKDHLGFEALFLFPPKQMSFLNVDKWIGK